MLTPKLNNVFIIDIVMSVQARANTSTDLSFRNVKNSSSFTAKLDLQVGKLEFVKLYSAYYYTTVVITLRTNRESVRYLLCNEKHNFLTETRNIFCKRSIAGLSINCRPQQLIKHFYHASLKPILFCTDLVSLIENIWHTPHTEAIFTVCRSVIDVFSSNSLPPFALSFHIYKSVLTCVCRNSKVFCIGTVKYIQNSWKTLSLRTIKRWKDHQKSFSPAWSQHY